MPSGTAWWKDKVFGERNSAGTDRSAFQKPRMAGLRGRPVSVIVTDMKVTSRDFQRDFARMKAVAATGETIHVTSGDERFVFQSAKPKTWQKSLKGRIEIKGDIFGTGLGWEASR